MIALMRSHIWLSFFYLQIRDWKRGEIWIKFILRDKFAFDWIHKCWRDSKEITLPKANYNSNIPVETVYPGVLRNVSLRLTSCEQHPDFDYKSNEWCCNIYSIVFMSLFYFSRFMATLYLLIQNRFYSQLFQFFWVEFRALSDNISWLQLTIRKSKVKY